MITYDHIMVRFGELSTKGKNKIDFIRVLFHNCQRALKEFDKLHIYMRHDHIYVELNGAYRYAIYQILLKRVGSYEIGL